MMSSRRKQTNPNRVSAGAHDLEAARLPLVDGGAGHFPTDLEPNDSEEGLRNSCDVGSDSGPISPDPGHLQQQRHHNQQQQPQKRPLPSEHKGREFDTPLDMHVSIISCPHCPETFPTYQELKEHTFEMHGPDPKRNRTEAESEDFPTAYHRLGRELQEITDAPLPNGHSETESSPRPLGQNTEPSPGPTSGPSEPQLSQNTTRMSEEIGNAFSEVPLTPKSFKEGSGGETANGKSDRIFHMDAYCDLCDREFCNKYFLKTHKANKHGIYEDNSPPATSVPLPFPGFMMPQDPMASFNFKMDSMKPPPTSEPLLPWSFKLDSPSSSSKKSENSPSVKLDASLPMFPMPATSQDNSKPVSTKNSSSSSSSISNYVSSSSSASTSANATSMLTNITNSIKGGSSNSNPPATDPSMEDYCHICQKHFCNKYYLKKHKQDVHGIAPENPPNSSNKRSRSSLMDLPLSSSNPMILPQPLASLAGMPNIPGMPGLPSMPGMPNMPNMPNMPPGVMVINPYSLPPVAIIPAGSLMPGQQIPPPPHPIISQPLSITPLPDSALLPPAPPTPCSLANGSGQPGQTPSKPSPSQQDGGVHCSICSKEFCNEFYLQIHKESKHGLKRGSEELPRDKPLTFSKDSKVESNKSSPPPLSSISKTEPSVVSSRSPMNHTPTSDGGYMVCSLCNKEFNNKYLYRIHRIHDHGLNEMIDPTLVENGKLPDKEDAMRNMNQSLMRMAADASAVGYASSFGMTPPSKPQDSAVCDICNKEMTNQYFLRLHKFNIHGIDPSTNEKYEKKMSSPLPPKSRTPPCSGSLPISSPSQQPLNLTHHTPAKHPMLSFLPPKMDFKDMPPFADFGRDFKGFRDMPTFLTDTINNELFSRSQNHGRHMDLNFFGLPPLGKMPGEENVKLNFDPEAYCEICKKEFCSKYFLRTHKQNIHGIKIDVPPSPNSKNADSDKNSYMSSMKPSSGGGNNGKTKDGYEKSSWRWKEPVNSSRVVCEICNKEVCNKYFLRTHKQKKHGIMPTSQSPNVSVNGSPIASDCDSASNASSQPDEKPGKMDASFSMPQMIPLPPTEKLAEKFQLKSLGYSKNKDDIPLNNNVEQSETCNICNRRFKNQKWLKDHIIKDHSHAEALDMRSKSQPPIYTCQVCGVDFPAELSVQLHLIQEHNARVTLDTEDTVTPTEEASLPNGEGSKSADFIGLWGLRRRASNHKRLKKYICARCGFDTHWLSSLLDHEKHEHGIFSEPPSAFSCKVCHLSLPSPNSLSAHMVTIHGFTVEDALTKVKNADRECATTTGFKCTLCSSVFQSRAVGMAHIRNVHIRKRHDLTVKNSFEKSSLRCPSCPFKTHFAFRLQRHVKCRHRRSLRTGVKADFPATSCPAAPLISPSLRTPAEVSSTSSAAPREQSGSPANSSTYKSIAASLLSAPEGGGGGGGGGGGRPESPLSRCDREELLMQNYKIPLGSSPVHSPSFKMTAQTSAASAVMGL